MDLKTFLIKNSISQNSFAKHLGISHFTLNRYFNGTRNPSKKILVKIKVITNNQVTSIESNPKKLNKYLHLIYFFQDNYGLKLKDIAILLNKNPQHIKKYLSKGMFSSEEELKLNKFLTPFIEKHARSSSDKFYRNFFDAKELYNFSNLAIASDLSMSESLFSKKLNKRDFSLHEINKIQSFLNNLQKGV